MDSWKDWKKKWDREFQEKTHNSAKGLRNNASRFKKVRKGSRDLQNPPQISEEINIKEKIKWDNEEEVKLVQMVEEVKNGEIRFMERFKRAWDECDPEFRHLTM